MPARWSLGVFMYSTCRHAELSQRPSILIVASLMPHWLAVVAAPIRKLCPAYLLASTPAFCNRSRTFLMKWSFVRFLPSLNWNKNPALSRRMARNAIMASTGQSCEWVLPRKMSIPLQNGSVLEALIQTLSVFGSATLSTAMSP